MEQLNRVSDKDKKHQLKSKNGAAEEIVLVRKTKNTS